MVPDQTTLLQRGQSSPTPVPAEGRGNELDQAGEAHMSEFAGKVALVTGGASGIGQATAAALAGYGATVVAADNAGTGQDSAAVPFGEAGGAVVERHLDVTDEQNLADVVAALVAEFGRLDTVVTAAGVQRYGSAADTDTAMWNQVLAVNVTGTFLTVKQALPHLRDTGGTITVVSSVQAMATQSDVAAYTASKGALNALVRSIAVDEAPHGVRANAVLPGSVDTPMLRASAMLFGGDETTAQRLLTAWGKSHPMGRIARPSEIAEAIAFLASPRASFITGACLPVDGGLLAALPVALPD